MKKLFISNLCTFILTAGISFFVYSSSLEKETEAIVYQHKLQSIKENAKKMERTPSSISPEAVRIAEARAEMARLKQNIQYDPDNWNDHFLMRYQGTKDVNGELVSISDLYRPYFTDLHKLLKKYYGTSASKRLSQLMTARDKYDEEINKAGEEDLLELEIENEKQHILIEKKATAMQKDLEESGDYTKEEINKLIGHFKDRQHDIANSNHDKNLQEKIGKVSQLYEFEKKKILGAAYLEAERLKEHYNEQYHKAYGNLFYKVSGEWDDSSKEYVHYDEPIEKESDEALFSIQL